MCNLCLCLSTMRVLYASFSASLSVALALLGPLSLGEGGGMCHVHSYLVI